jgi:hypothetical protein
MIELDIVGFDGVVAHLVDRITFYVLLCRRVQLSIYSC